MQINDIRRPWHDPTKKYGNRVHIDPFYQGTTWKRTRTAFKLGTSILPNGKPVSNALCYDCAILGLTTPMHTVDHVIPIEEGGSRTNHDNLKSRCLSHHNSKSAKEGNGRRKQTKE